MPFPFSSLCLCSPWSSGAPARAAVLQTSTCPDRRTPSHQGKEGGRRWGEAAYFEPTYWLGLCRPRRGSCSLLVLLFLPTGPGNWFLPQAATSARPAAAAGPGQVAVWLLFLIVHLMEHETTAGDSSPRGAAQGGRGVGPAGGPGSGVLPHCSCALALTDHGESRTSGSQRSRAPGRSLLSSPHPCPAQAAAAVGPPFTPKESRGSSGPQFPFSIKSAGPCSP